jgi:D-sedoheptulose 7-phosphate isomerase
MTKMEEEIKDRIQESMDCKKELFNEVGNIKKATEELIECFKRGNKVLIFGNGGSAADSQHIAAELVGKFKMKRRPFPAMALTTDTSMLTAWSNDESFEGIFKRQVEAFAREKDILIGLSTSGMSENVVNALKKGKEIGTINISFTGNDGGTVKLESDININSSSDKTERIQECHILAYHIICEFIEKGVGN